MVPSSLLSENAVSCSCRASGAPTCRCIVGLPPTNLSKQRCFGLPGRGPTMAHFRTREPKCSRGPGRVDFCLHDWEGGGCVGWGVGSRDEHTDTHTHTHLYLHIWRAFLHYTRAHTGRDASVARLHRCVGTTDTLLSLHAKACRTGGASSRYRVARPIG